MRKCKEFKQFKGLKKFFCFFQSIYRVLISHRLLWYNKNVKYKKILMEGVIDMSEAKTAKDLPACPVETTLMLIGDKWKVLILRDLLPGTKRFGELKKSIGSVSQKVLTAQLRDMEESGLVSRKVYAEVPPRVEYSLTELGQSLKPILDSMWNWGEEYKASLN